jgi:hypothetical protein
VRLPGHDIARRALTYFGLLDPAPGDALAAGDDGADALTDRELPPERVAGVKELVSALSMVAASIAFLVALLHSDERLGEGPWAAILVAIGTLCARWLLADEHPMRGVLEAREAVTPPLIRSERPGDVARAALARVAVVAAGYEAVSLVWEAAGQQVLVSAATIGVAELVEWAWVRRYEHRRDVIAIRVVCPDGAEDEEDDESFGETVLVRRDPVLTAFGR